MEEHTLEALLRIAYKKLKGYAYWEKSQLQLIHDVAMFDQHAESELRSLKEALLGDNNAWVEKQSDVLKDIGTLTFPKTLGASHQNGASSFFTNHSAQTITVEAVQNYIRLSVLGHVLGTLWTMTIGAILDNRLSEATEANTGLSPMSRHSYGNRLRNHLLFETEEGIKVSKTPYLLEPYFEQYERWREEALQEALQCINKNKDVLILTLDIKSFYPSVDISKKHYNAIFRRVQKTDTLKRLQLYYNVDQKTLQRVHDFVYCVLESYARHLNKTNIQLPIGFLPSAILSNWVLTPLDTKVTSQIAPRYYGRYVDDIIIVQSGTSIGQLTAKSKPSGSNHQDETPDIMAIARILLKGILGGKKHSTELFISKKCTPHCSSTLSIQKEKLRAFYFCGGKPAALLEGFRQQIAKTASTFQFPPDISETCNSNDYSEILAIKHCGSPNTLRAIESCAIDRYGLSKFLGKIYFVARHIKNPNDTLYNTIQKLPDLLSAHDLIMSYTLWQRMLELSLLAKRPKTYKALIKMMYAAIDSISTPSELLQPSELKASLNQFLHHATIRALSLVWGETADALYRFSSGQTQKPQTQAFCLSDSAETHDFSTYRTYYLTSGMSGRHTTALPTWCINFHTLRNHLPRGKDIYLFDLQETLDVVCSQIAAQHPKTQPSHSNVAPEASQWGTRFRLHLQEALKGCDGIPFQISPSEVQQVLSSLFIANGLAPSDSVPDVPSAEELAKILNELAPSKNLSPGSQSTRQRTSFRKACHITSLSNDRLRHTISREHITRLLVSIQPPSSEARHSLDNPKIAIANVRPTFENTNAALNGHPNLSSSRYLVLRDIITAAMRERADILVMPECYLPYEWVPWITTYCAQKQLAIITGIEPVCSTKNLRTPPKTETKVYNLTAVILPYTLDDGSRFAALTYHHKVHYAPEEKLIISNHGYQSAEGHIFHLFHWKGLWFPVFCCFELTSITDRCCFGQIPDITFAVEQNRDTGYFSNIVESLSRDLHCYCVQVNSSEYGDNRIVAPSGQHFRDLVRIKGGSNNTILTETLKIAKLRNFQAGDMDVDQTLKPLPPGFDQEIPRMKRDGELFNWLTQPAK